VWTGGDSEPECENRYGWWAIPDSPGAHTDRSDRDYRIRRMSSHARDRPQRSPDGRGPSLSRDRRSLEEQQLVGRAAALLSLSTGERDAASTTRCWSAIAERNSRLGYLAAGDSYPRRRPTGPVQNA
jgi:hypothetical protein